MAVAVIVLVPVQGGPGYYVEECSGHVKSSMRRGLPCTPFAQSASLPICQRLHLQAVRVCCVLVKLQLYEHTNTVDRYNSTVTGAPPSTTLACWPTPGVSIYFANWRVCVICYIYPAICGPKGHGNSGGFLQIHPVSHPRPTIPCKTTRSPAIKVGLLLLLHP